MATALGRFRSSDTPGLRCSPATRDAAPRRPGRDQDPEEENGGKLVCRIVEDRNGSLHIMDAGRARLRARRATDGTLEIHHLPDQEEDPTGDEGAEAPAENGDPRFQVTGERPPGGADPQRTGVGDGLSRYMRTGRSEDHMGALAAYQARLDAHYNRRN
jgi:hypothetical protein